MKKKLAMPKATWDSARRKIMRILLQIPLAELDTILKSYWARKPGAKSGGSVERRKQTQGLEGRTKYLTP